MDHISTPVVHGFPRTDEPKLVGANHPRMELPDTEVAQNSS